MFLALSFVQGALQRLTCLLQPEKRGSLKRFYSKPRKLIVSSVDCDKNKLLHTSLYDTRLAVHIFHPVKYFGC